MSGAFGFDSPRDVPPRIRKEISSGALLGGEREILIRHGGECYRLRHTRNNKLILTK
ncbi:hemin uptake protein HemP [Lysobacter pythonis]|uniref:Hemin uptake protein HemP n=1 Tax=Solilutibacter pythonis TaxID=2483112 RepID=A0A3M2HZ06_9GAMM|nr:hemin uptake protein HemP [Lysobacter pythonis]RMH91074.1 hemin uptake protein HemP [Lysobacter pythonis]